MEIPVLNRISDFEALHQNPSAFLLVSQTTLSIARVSHFWKWGSFLLLALLATFSGLLTRFTSFVLSFRRLHPLPSATLFHYESDADTDSSSDDEHVEEEDELDEDDSETDENWRRADEDFRVRGSTHYVDDQWQSRKLRLRHRRSIGDLFSWPDLAPGKSVVKLWDNLSLGLDFHDGGNVFSLHDINKDQQADSFFLGNCDAAAISASSPPVVVSAGTSAYSNNIELKVWDRRVSCRIPAILAEWQSQVVNFNGSNLEKLFARGGGELTVGDLRKANAPLGNVTESDVDTWWDSDAVMVTDEFLDTLDGESYKWAVARCCGAVRSHLWLGRDQQNL